MSASGKTPNFDFPLYEVQDNFAPLTSFNLLSNKADQQLALVKSSADTAEALSSANEQDIQALETWKAGLMAQLQYALSPVELPLTSSDTLTGWKGQLTDAGVSKTMLGKIQAHNGIANLPKFTYSSTHDLYVFATSSKRLYNTDIPSSNAKLIAYAVGSVNVNSEWLDSYIDVYCFQQSNITYFAAMVGKNSNLLNNNCEFFYSTTFFSN